MVRLVLEKVKQAKHEFRVCYLFFLSVLRTNK